MKTYVSPRAALKDILTTDADTVVIGYTDTFYGGFAEQGTGRELTIKRPTVAQVISTGRIQHLINRKGSERLHATLTATAESSGSDNGFESVKRRMLRGLLNPDVLSELVAAEIELIQEQQEYIDMYMQMEFFTFHHDNDPFLMVDDLFGGRGEVTTDDDVIATIDFWLETGIASLDRNHSNGRYVMRHRGDGVIDDWYSYDRMWNQEQEQEH